MGEASLSLRTVGKWMFGACVFSTVSAVRSLPVFSGRHPCFWVSPFFAMETGPPSPQKTEGLDAGVSALKVLLSEKILSAEMIVNRYC